MADGITRIGDALGRRHGWLHLYEARNSSDWKPSMNAIFPSTPLGLLQSARFLRHMQPDRRGARCLATAILDDRGRWVAYRIDRPRSREIAVSGPTWRDTRHLVRDADEAEWLFACEEDGYPELDEETLQSLRPGARGAAE